MCSHPRYPLLSPPTPAGPLYFPSLYFLDFHVCFVTPWFEPKLLTGGRVKHISKTYQWLHQGRTAPSSLATINCKSYKSSGMGGTLGEFSIFFDSLPKDIQTMYYGHDIQTNPDFIPAPASWHGKDIQAREDQGLLQSPEAY